MFKNFKFLVFLSSCLPLFFSAQLYANTPPPTYGENTSILYQTRDKINRCNQEFFSGKLPASDSKAYKECGEQNKLPDNPNERQTVSTDTGFKTCLGAHASSEADESIKKQYKRCIDRAYGMTPDADTNYDQKSCDEAGTEFDKYYGDFVTACSASGMGGSGETCLRQTAKCADCDPYAKRRDRPKHCGKVGGQVMQVSAQMMPMLFGGGEDQADPNIGGQMARWQKCPAYAGTYLEGNQEKIQEGRDRISNLETELANIEEEMAAMLSEQKREEIRVQEELDAIDNEVTEKIAEFQQAEKDAREDNASLISELQARIYQAEQSNREAKLQIQQLRLEKDKKLAEERMGCYRVAHDKMAAFQEQKKELIGASLYSAGGFNNLLKSVGLTNEEKLKALTEKYYRACKKGPEYKEATKLIEKEYQLQRMAINAQINANYRLIARVKEEIISAKARLPEVLRDLFQRLQDYQASAEKKIDRLHQRLASYREDMARKQSILQGRYDSKREELEREESFLRQRQAYGSLAASLGGGAAGGEDKDINEAISNSMTALRYARNMLDSCYCCQRHSQTVEGAGSKCRRAYDFINEYYNQNDAAVDCDLRDNYKGSGESTSSKSTN